MEILKKIFLPLCTDAAVTFSIRYKRTFYHIWVIKLVTLQGTEKNWCLVLILQLLNQKFCWFGFTALLIQFFLLLLLMLSMLNMVAFTCMSLNLPGGEKVLVFVYYIFGRRSWEGRSCSNGNLCLGQPEVKDWISWALHALIDSLDQAATSPVFRLRQKIWCVLFLQNDNSFSSQNWLNDRIYFTADIKPVMFSQGVHCASFVL